MGGISSMLQIAKGALAVQQYALNVTGNNIANVNNSDYSLQTVQQVNNGSINYAGLTLGTGVTSDQVEQSVDQLLENRLTEAEASLSGSEAAETYITIIESYFNDTSGTGISNALTDLWDSWSDLANNPDDDSERLIVLESGEALAEQFNAAYDYLDQIEIDINTQIVSAVDRINEITEDIAELNQDIMGDEIEATANDKRDQRNALVDELGELIDINVFEQSNGAVTINVAEGLPIVSGTTAHQLTIEDDQIAWVNSSGGTQKISDEIAGGQIGGWLDIRDSIIPEYEAELNELASEVIWAVNYQHSQGVGLNYFSDTLTGTYETDESGWLSSLSYGSKIDYSSDLTMWIEDDTTSDTQYSEVTMDMGVSEAAISNWQSGADLPAEDAVYKLTVVDGTTIGDNLVIQSDGDRLTMAQASTVAGQSVAEFMQSADAPIVAQTLTISGGASGTQTVDIAYSGGDAKQSAASIAEALNEIDGVTAYAAENSALLDVTAIASGAALADGSTVSFGIYVDGVTHIESFTVDSTLGGIQEQFEDAFLAAAESLNEIYGDEDLTLTWDVDDASATQFTLTSSSGRTIGLQDLTTDPASASHIEFSGNGTTAVQIGSGDSAAVASTLTVEVEEGMSIASSVAGAAGGIFSGTTATTASSIITLGGEGGYSDFTGSTISFEVDGIAVSYSVGADTTDEEFSIGLESALNTALGANPDYTVMRNGTSVSILKASGLDEPIEISDFVSTGTNTTLSTSTGTGSGTSAPDNDLLIANDPNPLRNSSTSSLYEDSGIIMWEKYDTNGIATGESGLITVEDAGEVTITDSSGNELLTFDLSAGSLVAGNTMSINVNLVDDGVNPPYAEPDTLDFTVDGSANVQNETYMFKVVSGGTIGTLPATGESSITIEWDNGITYGTFVIEESDPPLTPATPYEVEVDGMTLQFTSGTLIEGDVFTITTDSSGNPVSTNEDGDATGELMSDWHWTLESFADQFNRVGQGMTATVVDNKLELSASGSYNVITNMEYSDTNGFTEENLFVEVTDWSAMDFEAEDLQFVRSASGDWSIANDPTGGNATLIPEGGDDDGFGVDFNGDGLADIEITFAEKVTGDGVFSFDLVQHDAEDIGFAFSDESGVIAAAGINTFFAGDDALTMEINSVIEDTSFIAAATIDPETGAIDSGDSSNALALADVQYESINMRQWSFSRGSDTESSISTTTLDGYYSTMLGALGVDVQNVQSAKEFSTLMVNYLTSQRNSVSAVSLDEEMIKLIEYQQAFTAASKLVSVADEMFDTIINLR